MRSFGPLGAGEHLLFPPFSHLDDYDSYDHSLCIYICIRHANRGDITWERGSLSTGSRRLPVSPYLFVCMGRNAVCPVEGGRGGTEPVLRKERTGRGQADRKHCDRALALKRHRASRRNVVVKRGIQ